jgi:hypothetical protein
MDFCYDGWTDRVPQKAPTSTRRIHWLTGRNAFESIEVELPLKGGKHALTEPTVGMKSTVGDEKGGVRKRRRRYSTGFSCESEASENMCSVAMDDKFLNLQGENLLDEVVLPENGKAPAMRLPRDNALHIIRFKLAEHVVELQKRYEIFCRICRQG